MNDHRRISFLENGVNQCLHDIDLDRFGSIEEQPNEGKEIMTIDFTLPPEAALEHLTQIQDNSEALESITTMLNLISLIQAKSPCENCKESHDIVTSNSIVAGLYQGIRAISRYSDLLAHLAKSGIVGRKEEPTDQVRTDQ